MTCTDTRKIGYVAIRGSVSGAGVSGGGRPGLACRPAPPASHATLSGGASEALPYLDSYGTLEQAPLLHFLSRYPVTAYTYRLSAAVSRGQRPDGAKLADLAGGQRYRATINLCAEMDGGDAPAIAKAAIAKAGLTGALRTRQVPITDMEPPTVAQVIEILDLLSGPDAEPTYVHCEAGRARTGVAIACYRMAVMGWSAADALTEAVNFGCIVPGQQAFISQFGDLLEKGTIAGRYYPLLPPGSVKPTAAELAATIHSAAAAAIQNAAAAIQSAAATIHSAAADAEQGAVS